MYRIKIFSHNKSMKTSTKILSVLTALFFVPTLFLFRFILQGIIPNGQGFDFSFSTLGYLALIFTGVFVVLFVILYVKFLRSQRLVGAIFFATLPITLVYGGFAIYTSNVTQMTGITAQSVRATMNIGEQANLNSYLWAIFATLAYLVTIFLIILIMCRPLSRVENITQKLGDGRMKYDDYKVGGGKQFKEIEHSLNRINYNIKVGEHKVKQNDFVHQKSVPKNFLKMVGRSGRIELECGNEIKKEVTLLLCEIKDEKRQTNFEFLNEKMKAICAQISKNDGFVDKYLKDGVLAVFARAENALECANSILKTKSKHFDFLISVSTEIVKFGVGQDEKMPTIISNELEFLEQMQRKNAALGTKVIFSKNTLNRLPQKYDLSYRFVGVVEGLNMPIYEGLSVAGTRKKRKFLKLKNRFEDGVQLFHSKNFQSAKDEFSFVLKHMPDDAPAYFYFNLIVEKLKETA